MDHAHRRLPAKHNGVRQDSTPFGLPVVPELKITIAGSDARVTTGGPGPASSRSNLGEPECLGDAARLSRKACAPVVLARADGSGSQPISASLSRNTIASSPRRGINGTLVAPALSTPRLGDRGVDPG